MPASIGAAAAANSVGLVIEGGSNNTIGLGATLSISPPQGNSISFPITVSGLNLISGNTGDGILIEPSAGGTVASDNLIQDSFIGTDSTGLLTSTTYTYPNPVITEPLKPPLPLVFPLSNGGYGIQIDQSMNNTVGGPTADAFVLVSNNTSGGSSSRAIPPSSPRRRSPTAATWSRTPTSARTPPARPRWGLRATAAARPGS